MVFKMKCKYCLKSKGGYRKPYHVNCRRSYLKAVEMCRNKIKILLDQINKDNVIYIKRRLIHNPHEVEICMNLLEYIDYIIVSKKTPEQIQKELLKEDRRK